ncbi:thiamine-phosphate kinase [Candidatus Woesearchaeota archaeon]|nr:thiamine-phosphate kinase [Candidatus Woesearchaeota archaeon]
MKISELGGEFALIKRLARGKPPKDVAVGIGDDCAVVRIGKKLICITTDSLVEGRHFSLKYFSPVQIGIKAMESNVSDIAAIGGIPKYAFVALTFRKSTPVEFADGLYSGMRKVCRSYGISIIGGDTSSGNEISITITLVGVVSKKEMCRRSDARPGDFILVSGDLGKSAAGLNLLKKGLEGKSTLFHLEPKSRLDFSRKYSKYINAMEDISDGLASEARTIACMSGVKAVVFRDNIPISEETFRAAKACGNDAYDYALFGGEDFELVYTVSGKNLGKVPGFLIGEIMKGKGVALYGDGKEKILKKAGYDHFR